MDHDLYLHVVYAEFCEVTLCFEYYMYCNNPNTGNCQTNFSCMCVCVCVCVCVQKEILHQCISLNYAVTVMIIPAKCPL